MINILSDGSPWRPLIHISDMARAIDWAINRELKDGGNMVIVNTGCDEWNYQVKDLAEAVAKEIPETRVEINQSAPPDKRSYKVDFSKFKELAPNHQPLVTLSETIRDLRDGLEEMGFSDSNFRNSQLIRLNVLNNYISSNKLTSNLNWVLN